MPFHKKLRITLMLLVLAAFTSGLRGAPVTPEKAMDEAAEFLGNSPRGMHRAPGDVALSLAYTSSNGDTPLYYVFNSNDGFLIVSADDRLPAILGYSDAGRFDESRIPDNMRAWLKGYSDEIAAFIPKEEKETSTAVSRPVHKVKRASIDPLISTRWDQGKPYNLLCPTDPRGGLCVTGCVATAYAQIIRYHEWPRNPTGSSGGMDFDGTTYNFRLMRDEYVEGNYTASQADAVARLMRQCGAAVNMQYSAWSSGAYNYDVQYALPVYFRYSPDLQMLWRDYIPYSDWADMIYKELAEKRPVFYSGASPEGGHAFVCDGYSENEYFHFNWGWGGYEDGYFLLTALNPASGGAGSFEGGYTSQQSIIIGIKPGTDSQKPVQRGIISGGGFFHASGNTFEIRGNEMGNNLIFNPLVMPATFQPALKIEAADGREFSPRYVMCGSEVTLPPLYGASSISSNPLPNLPDGQYKSSLCYRLAGAADWQPVPIPIGMQNFVLLNITDGSASWTNPGPDRSNSSKLIFGIPETQEVINSDIPVAMRIPVVNVGNGDFTASLGFSLMQSDGGDFGDASSVMQTFSIPAKSSQNLDITFPDKLSPGKYILSISDMTGKTYPDEYNLDIVKFNSPQKQPGGLKASNLSPNFITSGKTSPIYFNIKNPDIMSEDILFTFNVLDSSTLEKVKSLSSTFSVNVPGNYDGRVNVRPIDFGLQPGDYFICVADEEGNQLSDPAPLIVSSPIMESESGLAYVITSESKKEAILVAPEDEPYSGEIVVPESIDGYTISDVRNNAFTFASATSVSLPSGVNILSPGTFYDDNALSSITLASDTPVPFKENIVNPSAYKRIWLYVNQEIANPWLSSYGWCRFRSPLWLFNFTDVESPDLLIDPATKRPYAPYRMNFAIPLTLRFTTPDNKNVSITATRNGEWIFYGTIDPRTDVLELPALGKEAIGEVKATATSDQVKVDEIEIVRNSDIFTIDGRIIMRNAEKEDLKTLEPGIYIIQGKKFVIK